MPVDISQLGAEKRAFLKASGLLESLETAIPKKLGKIQKRKRNLDNGKAKWQREIQKSKHRAAVVKGKAEDMRAKAEQVRREHLLHLPQDLRRLMEKNIVIGDKQLVCPVCGSGVHHGNNWCFKCNSPLIPKDKVAQWVSRKKVKTKREALRASVVSVRFSWGVM